MPEWVGPLVAVACAWVSGYLTRLLVEVAHRGNGGDDME